MELIQARPGITADQLGAGLGVTGRAARRYVAILREADLPIESVSGPYGGYRVGRGLRLPPLMFTAAEAAGLVMATLEGHPGAADPADVVGGALAKILRSLPDHVGPGMPEPTGTATRHEHLDALLAASASSRVVRLDYRAGDRAGSRVSAMEVEPWAVVLRHSRWYLLCWSRSRDAQRVLRVDRVVAVETLPSTYAPPDDLDALRVIEEHFSQGWPYAVEVLVDAPPSWVRRWVPRSLARLEAVEGDRTRMVATTEDPDWYARQLAAIPVTFRVVDSPELLAAVRALGRRLVEQEEPAPRVGCMLETQRERVPLDDDGELDTALAFLDFQRACVFKKIDGLSEEQLRRRLVVSGTTLLGLVKHFIDGEHWWFAHHVGGDPAYADIDWDRTMDVPESVTAAELVADYRAAIEESDRHIATAGSPETLTALPVGDAGPRTLRWVLAHNTAEIARHLGHMDILRELIDETTGR